MPLTVHDALEAWSEGRISTGWALELTGCADVDELLVACDSSDVPRPGANPEGLDGFDPMDDAEFAAHVQAYAARWRARRAALKAKDAALDAGRESIPGGDVPADEAAIEAAAVDACRQASLVRWRIEDGTGSSTRVGLDVRVLVGTERSTVIVSDPITGRAHSHEVVPHGSEAASAGAAVERAVRKQMAVNEVIELVRGAPDVPPDPGDEW